MENEARHRITCSPHDAERADQVSLKSEVESEEARFFEGLHKTSKRVILIPKYGSATICFC